MTTESNQIIRYGIGRTIFANLGIWRQRLANHRLELFGCGHWNNNCTTHDVVDVGVVGGVVGGVGVGGDKDEAERSAKRQKCSNNNSHSHSNTAFCSKMRSPLVRSLFFCLIIHCRPSTRPSQSLCSRPQASSASDRRTDRRRHWAFKKFISWTRLANSNK
jgi:hypothetical protein